MSLVQCNFLIITCKVCDKFIPRRAASNGVIPAWFHAAIIFMLNTLYDENAGTHAESRACCDYKVVKPEYSDNEHI